MTQKASWELWSWHGGESFDDTAHSMRWSPKAMMQWFSRIMGTIHLLPGACRVIPKDWKASNADEFEPGGIRRGSIFTVDFRLGEGWSLKASYSYWYPEGIWGICFVFVVVVVVIKTNESLYSIVKKPCKMITGTWRESSNSMGVYTVEPNNRKKIKMTLECMMK